MRWPHILVVGGTGMLQAASVALAQRCDALTSVARTARSLDALHQQLGDAGCAHHRLPLDWQQEPALLQALGKHLRQVGAPTLALVWVHDDALALKIIALIATFHVSCDFFHVRGSSAASPEQGADALAAQAAAWPELRYHAIILGFHLGPHGSRWLRDEEIAAGALAAIEQPAPRRIVGVVRPWELRP